MTTGTSGVQIYPTTGQGLPLVGATGSLSALDDLLRFPVMGPDPDDLVVRTGAVSVGDFKVYVLSEAQDILDATQAIYDAFDSTFLGVYADDAAAETAAGGTPDDGAQYFNSTASENRIYVDGTWYPMSYNSTNVAITGGTIEGVEISGLTGPITIADGGTGGETVNEAVTALGLDTTSVHATADETDPDAILLTSGLGVGTIPVGFEVTWIATATNTGALTIALDGGAAEATSTPTGADLPAGYVRVFNATTAPVRMRAWWNGTKWTVHRGTEIISVGSDTAVRYEDGIQEVNLKKVQMDQTNTDRCLGTATFPAPFKNDNYAPNVTLRPDADDDPFGNIDDDISTTLGEIGTVAAASKLVGSMVIGVVATDGGLLPGDTMYASVYATGKWY